MNSVLCLVLFSAMCPYRTVLDRSELAGYRIFLSLTEQYHTVSTKY
jgi:hypothetical protein